MDFQPWMEWLVPALCALLGGSGFWALLSARATARATQAAAATAAQPAMQSANTADWSSLMSYWQSEMNALRETATRLEVRINLFEHQREEDLAHIEELYQHIWQHKPPPPPPRRQAPGSISGAFTITPEGSP